MVIKQLSIFVENKKGRLYAITKLLADNNIDLSALSLADTSEFGILRVIVDKLDKAKEILRESGVTVKTTDVIAVVVDDNPGGAAKIIEIMSDNDISIEYMYAYAGKVTGKAMMIVKVDNAEKVNALLAENGLDNVSPEDILRK